MRAAIIYFSGTGNTKKVAEKYAECLAEQGCACDLFSLPLKELPDLSGYDFIGIGYPIHSFNAPQIVLRFAKALPKRKDKKKVFILKSSGEPVKMSRVSSLKLKSILKRRGYLVTNEYQYCMPYNMIFRHTDHMAYVMWGTAKALIPIDCADIVNGVAHPEKKMPFGRLFAWVLRIEHGGAKFNGLFYKVKGKCIGCGKCAKNCPVGNIRMKNGKPKFGRKCMMCARCSFYCPANCIKIGLFNGWRINGAYSFEDGDPNEKNGHENYCKKAYARYFREAEERISAARQTASED
ncbi:MAG: EFR1 family ferrodoxin [Clostridiales bacterium]|nr:EFR1 family ferrodoxin [Clostridiales bacterium]